MRIVAALGGNALLRRGEAMTEGNQRANVQRAAAALAPLCTDKNEVILTHGNGPQVGLLALQAESYEGVDPYPLDVLGAQSEGMIGFLIEHYAGKFPVWLSPEGLRWFVRKTWLPSQDLKFRSAEFRVYPGRQ